MYLQCTVHAMDWDAEDDRKRRGRRGRDEDGSGFLLLVTCSLNWNPTEPKLQHCLDADP